MKTRQHIYFTLSITGLIVLSACKAPSYMRDVNNTVPETYIGGTDTTTIADISWRDYFRDSSLIKLIDSALVYNQEFNIAFMSLQLENNEVMARKGEYQPFLSAGFGGGVDKVGRYTTHGAMEATTEMEPGKEIPEYVPDLNFGAYARWEIDIWGKLHNAKRSALKKYFASVEGRNFLQTQIVSEIASLYYELQALDKQLQILDQNISIQNDALKFVSIEKAAARVTELAVQRFEAEVYFTKSLRYQIQQDIVETENRINFLLGRYPQKVERNPVSFDQDLVTDVQSGIPAQLLDRRTDVKQAEMELEAAKVDVMVAKANFYPSLGLKAGIGMNAFNPTYLIRPESMLLNAAGDLVGPVLNRKAIKAAYYSANAKQMQAVYEYERTLLNAMIEVVNEMNNIENLKSAYELKNKQVQALSKAIIASNNLFMSARADYTEVLMTQRDALESKFELIETRKQQLQAQINIYKALGGGWR